MLKIKDNIDLKELEKFGYYLCNREVNTYQKNLKIIYPLNYHGLGKIVSSIFIDINRNIKFINATENDIQDLIKADMVEKAVEDEHI